MDHTSQSSLFRKVPPTKPEQSTFWAFSGEKEMLNGRVRLLCRMRAQKAAAGSKDEFVPRG